MNKLKIALTIGAVFALFFSCTFNSLSDENSTEIQKSTDLYEQKQVASDVITLAQAEFFTELEAIDTVSSKSIDDRPEG